MKVECNLCGQEFQEIDPMLKERMEIHEGRHMRTSISKNQIIGQVKWIRKS